MAERRRRGPCRRRFADPKANRAHGPALAVPGRRRACTGRFPHL